MARKFRDATRLLHDLLDRHEAGTANVRAYPDHEAFRNVTEADRFERELSRPGLAGAVKLVSGTGRHQDRTVRVDLRDAGALYRYLERMPARSRAQEAAELALGDLDLDAAFESVVREAIEAWSRNKRWSGLGPGDTQGLRNALLLAQAIVQDRHKGLDYRTFSRRIAGNSKALEELEQTIVRVLASVHELPSGRDPRSFLSELGLDRFGPPLLLAGPVVLDGLTVPLTLPYVGIPANAVTRLTFHREPDYILSIENQTSFNRQVLEMDSERFGLVLYTGGYPSVDIQRAIAYIAASLPHTPFFHWSDIDPEGVWIFRTVERAAGRAIIPHLMDPVLAESRGTLLVSPAKLRSKDFEGSAIVDLVRYFEKPESKWLEQEEFDPETPIQ